ncbi:MAG TPA: hypothetical protein VHA75_15005 [Rugosimonospora sp.]|nr:hypothetical protein [Rugosimonospora sp.]
MQDVNGNFTNLDHVVGMSAQGADTTWTIKATTTVAGAGSADVTLDGVFASAAEAQTAITRLIAGLDPADY